jgi:hypothetical protein
MRHNQGKKMDYPHHVANKPLSQRILEYIIPKSLKKLSKIETSDKTIDSN